MQVHLLKTVAFSRISISQDIKQLKLNSDPFFFSPLSCDADFVQNSDSWQEEINKATLRQSDAGESLCGAGLDAVHGKSLSMFGIR